MIRPRFLIVATGILAIGLGIWFNYRRDPLPSELAGMPGVAAIETRLLPAPAKKGWVVQLVDYRFVPETLFAMDLRQEAGRPLTDAEVAQMFKEHLDDVEKVQQAQAEMLAWLIRHKQVSAVYVEGLIHGQEKGYITKANILAKMAAENLPQMEKQLAEVRLLHIDKARVVESEIIGMMQQHRRERLELGAAADLVASGVLDVQGVEEENTLNAVGPRMLGVKLALDQDKQKERDRIMAKRLAASDAPIRVIILGGDHDLTDAIQQAAPGMGYVRVVSRAFREAASTR